MSSRQNADHTFGNLDPTIHFDLPGKRIVRVKRELEVSVDVMRVFIQHATASEHGKRKHVALLLLPCPFLRSILGFRQTSIKVTMLANV